MSERRTSTDYRHPHRPWPLRLANRLVPARWPSLEREALVDAARRAEGLDDLGPPDLEPLDRLLESVHAEASLHTVGRIAVRTRIVNALRVRLRERELRHRHPETEAVALPAPVVITGLQRTGTTFLHRLLAEDPRLRALRSWEALEPIAPLSGSDGRLGRARTAERALRWMAPDFFAVHPVEHDAPEEEVLLLDHSFLSTVPEATLRVPTFARWLEDQDQRPAYVMLRRLLQAMTRTGGPERWVLKTPHHLEWLDVLLAVFPDARVVHTHRDPVVTLPSFCGMVAHGRGIMSDVVDPHEIGRDWLRKTGRMVDRAMATRAVHPEAFLDVDYSALTRDPLAEVARIYDHIGLTLPDAVQARIAGRRDAHPQHRYGRHVYRLEDFGLGAEQVSERFSAYKRRFGV